MSLYVQSHLKDMNRQVVFNVIAGKGVTSKAEISKLSGISVPTVIKIVNYLIEANLVKEIGAGESNLGRKPQLLTLNEDLMYFAVFFLEGEFLTYGLADITGKIVHKKILRAHTPFGDVMARIESDLIDALLDETGISRDKLYSVGIAIPGIYDPDQKVIASSPLIGVKEATNISGHIRAISKKYAVTVYVENDTNAQCLGEFRASGMPADKDLVFISVGSGIGCGVILGGELRRGYHNMCGEIGYFSFLDDSGYDKEKCGWLESKVNYMALEKEYGLGSATDISSLNEEKTADLLRQVSIPLSLCVNNIAMLLDCESIRIGGVTANMLGNRLIRDINNRLKNICISDIRVEKQTQDDIGLIGLASILSDQNVSNIILESNPG